MPSNPSGKISLSQLTYFTNQFNNINKKINILFDHLNNDFLVTSNKLKKYAAIAREKLQTNSVSVPLKEKFKEAVKSFDSIIIELQYHDIIRQKLEHIYSINSELIKDLNLAYEQQVDFPQPRYTLVFYDLMQLSCNQIANIRQEYIMASTKIQKQLFKLWSDREIAIELQLFLFNTANNHKNVTGTIDEICAILDELMKKNTIKGTEITTEKRMMILNEVKEVYTMYSERMVFNETFQIEEKLVTDDNVLF